MPSLGDQLHSNRVRRINTSLDAETDKAPVRTVKISLESTQLRTNPSNALTDTKEDQALESQESYAVGDRIHGFTLVEKIGTGSFATVFLAEQESIIGRLVVLKITSQRMNESDRLGKLQHPNIVPIYSVHRSGANEIICMPFLGRSTLERLIACDRQLPVKHTAQSSTSSSWFRLSTKSTLHQHHPASQSDHPTLHDESLSPLRDIDSILALLSDLASGLDHAHQRGILHLDIKPANVLFSESGVPMLFDFNLSHRVGESRKGLGGTIPYMAPEQLEELIDRDNRTVSHQTDLFGLGVLAFELLTREMLYPATGVSQADIHCHLKLRLEPPPSLRAINPAISPAIESIVWKLLDPNPHNRYQSALELKTDIDRQRMNLPLIFATNRSLRERYTKWKIRHPQLQGRLMAGLVVLLTIVLAVVMVRNNSHALSYAANELATDTHRQMSSVRLDLISFGNPVAMERGNQAATRILKQYGLPADDNWRNRSSYRDLAESQQKTVSADLGELLLLMAHNRTSINKRSLGIDSSERWDEAIRLNEIAGNCFPFMSKPTFVLGQKNELDERTGNGARIDSMVPLNGTRDYFLHAVNLLSKGQYSQAIPLLERVLAEEPGHAAAHFSLAVCRHQLGQYSRALERYDTAYALLPNDPRPAFNRGIIHGSEQRHAQAEAEFTQAIGIDPHHGESYRNRAVARMQLGRFHQAEADLTLALEHGASPIEVYFIRAQVREKRSDHRGAESDRHAANSYEPLTETDFIARGRSRLPLDPQGALTDFIEAERLNPRSLAALQNQAHVHSEFLHDDTRSLDAVSRVVEYYPEYSPARAGKAVLLARMGRRERAQLVAAELAFAVPGCLDQLPGSGVFARIPDLARGGCNPCDGSIASIDPPGLPEATQTSSNTIPTSIR
ncbi:MAG: serine/threonine-protein kinase [Gemmataceae bacterium]